MAGRRPAFIVNGNVLDRTVPYCTVMHSFKAFSMYTESYLGGHKRGRAGEKYFNRILEEACAARRIILIMMWLSYLFKNVLTLSIICGLRI